MKRVFSALLLMTILCGCGAGGNSTAEDASNTPDKIRRAYAKPYKAECAAAVVSNKGENAYTFTLDWRTAEDYTLIFDDMTVTVSGGQASLSGGSGAITASAVDGILPLLPGAFLASYFSLDTQEIREEDGLLVLNAPIASPTPYRAAMRLYLNPGRLTPVRLQVLDAQEKPQLQVDFLDFAFGK